MNLKERLRGILLEKLELRKKENDELVLAEIDNNIEGCTSILHERAEQAKTKVSVLITPFINQSELCRSLYRRVAVGAVEYFKKEGLCVSAQESIFDGKLNIHLEISGWADE